MNFWKLEYGTFRQKSYLSSKPHDDFTSRQNLMSAFITTQLMCCRSFTGCRTPPSSTSSPVTLMKECRVLPYTFRKCSLMSSMSISARATIILIRTLSVVPSPWGDNQTVWPRVKCTSVSSVTGMKYLPSSICIVALQRRPVCSSRISLRKTERREFFATWTQFIQCGGQKILRCTQ